MARYFFHTRNGGLERDPDGVELATLEEARAVAVRYAGDVLCENQALLWDGTDFRVMVTDEGNRLLFTVVTLAVDGTSMP